MIPATLSLARRSALTGLAGTSIVALMRMPLLVLLAVLVLTLSACGTPAPPSRLHRLSTAPPAVAGAPLASPSVTPDAASSASSTAAIWQLVTPVSLPQYLDRDALLTTRGTGGLQPLAGDRWAEPLRDAVPRVLVADLGRLRGVPVWSTPPPGSAAASVRQLRVELTAFEVSAGGDALQLQARWSLSGPGTNPLSQPPQLQQATIDVPIDSKGGAAGADALVAAHRLALWRLAERIAAAR
ncbi:MAG: ABC-type transport auxiliary lipoprotein family protein [Rubrivivax sp.]